MTLTFEPTQRQSDVIRYELFCWDLDCDDPVDVIHGSDYEAARRAERVHLVKCEECQHYSGMVVRPVSIAPSLNVAGVHGGELLRLLGFVSDGQGGACVAVDFLARVRRAQRPHVADEGVPWTEDRTPGGMVWIECGRSDGYLEGNLERLSEIGEWALKHGRDVQWA